MNLCYVKKRNDMKNPKNISHNMKKKRIIMVGLWLMIKANDLSIISNSLSRHPLSSLSSLQKYRSSIIRRNSLESEHHG